MTRESKACSRHMVAFKLGPKSFPCFAKEWAQCVPPGQPQSRASPGHRAAGLAVLPGAAGPGLTPCTPGVSVLSDRAAPAAAAPVGVQTILEGQPEFMKAPTLNIILLI